MDDLLTVSGIEEQLFGEAQRRGALKQRELMAVPAIKGRNLSGGAYADERLVGYVLAYPRPSLFVPGQTVVSVHYLGVLPAYRLAALGPLMEWVGYEAEILGYPAIEAQCTERLYRRLSRAERTLNYLGGGISGSKPMPGSDEPQFAIRIEHGEERWRVAHTLRFRTRVRLTRSTRTARALPRRCARRACLIAPGGAVPRSLLRWTYLDLSIDAVDAADGVTPCES
jgi:hypothetical protein